jgi:hypothetical protein
MNLPKNVLSMEVTFSRFGVTFVTEHCKDASPITYTLCHGMYDKNGDLTHGVSVYSHDCIGVSGDSAYVFADIDTILRVTANSIERAKEVPPAIHKKREQLLEKFHRFYTKWRVTVEDTHIQALCDGCEPIDIYETPTGVSKYFKPDGTFKSNGAFVRFFCAFIEEEME